MNPFVEASITAHATCVRLGWDTGDDQPVASKSLRGLRTLLRDLFEQGEREGCLAAVAGNFRSHVAQAPEARVRETVGMLVGGYGDLLELFRK